MKKRHRNTWTICDCSSTNLLYSLTNSDLRVDRLHSDYYIIFLEGTEVFVEESINEDDISWVNGWLHGGSVCIAESDYVSLGEEVGGDDGNDA